MVTYNEPRTIVITTDGDHLSVTHEDPHTILIAPDGAQLSVTRDDCHEDIHNRGGIGGHLTADN